MESLGTLLLAACHKEISFVPISLVASIKTPKDIIKDSIFAPTRWFPKELLAENLTYLSMVCSVSLKHLRKLNKWKTKEEVPGLKKNIYSRWTVSEVTSLRKKKKSSKDLTQDLRDASGPSVDPSTVGPVGSQHPKKSFGMSFKKPGKLFLKTI